MKQLSKGCYFKLLVLSLFIQSACTHEADIENMNEICFDTQVLPIIKTSCGISGCHDGTTGGFLATDYGSVMLSVKPSDARASTLYRIITDIRSDEMMPPDRPLTQLQRSIIQVWIDQGAYETICTEDTSGNANEICFVQDILPMLLSSCGTTGCHDAVTHEEGYIFTNYQTIVSRGITPFNPNNSEVMEVVTETGDDIMPPAPRSPLTSTQIAALREWIRKGAQNTDCPPAVCDTAGIISYTEDIVPVMQLACTGCHNSTLASGGVNLSDYSHVAVQANLQRNSTSVLLGVLKKQVGFSAMPPTYNLDACKIAIIEKWISQGASDN